VPPKTDQQTVDNQKLQNQKKVRKTENQKPWKALLPLRA
jgi:hypothetical protein